MGQPFDLFDIFKVSEDGSLAWVETAATLEAARAQVHGMQTASTGDYVVMNQKTGSKIILHLEGTKNTVRTKRATK
jgi:hypothetical protein